MSEFNLNDWYTVDQAAERLSANCGHEVSADYVRQIARYGKVRTHRLGARSNLYLRVDVDGYVVEERGTKSGRAKRQRAFEKRQGESEA